MRTRVRSVCVCIRERREKSVCVEEKAKLLCGEGDSTQCIDCGSVQHILWPTPREPTHIHTEALNEIKMRKGERNTERRDCMERRRLMSENITYNNNN
jgi:hypothetical protein